MSSDSTHWVATRYATEAFSTTCAVHTEDCEGWWLSGCHSSVAEHQLHKWSVLGLIPSGCQPFHCFYFTSNFKFDHLIIMQTSFFQNKRVGTSRQRVNATWLLAELHNTQWYLLGSVHWKYIFWTCFCMNVPCWLNGSSITVSAHKCCTLPSSFSPHGVKVRKKTFIRA